MSKEATARSAISTERAMKLALEALEAATRYGAGGFEDAKDALREALVEQPAPVAKPHERKPVNEGWKLVPVEPTEDMWKAVNKLDDEMAAGSYDGKGCSIEQAWNCLLAAAPQPAQPQQDDAWKAEQKTLADEAVKCATEALANPNHPATMAAREYYGAAQPQEPWGFHIQFNNGRDATFKGLDYLAECEAHQEAGETITLLYIKENT